MLKGTISGCFYQLRWLESPADARKKVKAVPYKYTKIKDVPFTCNNHLAYM